MRKALAALLLMALMLCAPSCARAEDMAIWPEGFVRRNKRLNYMLLDPMDVRYLSSWKNCDTPGTIVPLEYDTWFYARDLKDGDTPSYKTPVKKTAYVYLPYGYNENKKYNILYLLHGIGGDETSWFTTIDNSHRTKRVPGTAARLLDNMIASGEMPPCIVVTPSYYLSAEDTESRNLSPMRLIEGFSYELPDLIQAVESQYSTYATSTSRKALTASRDHRAFAGLSMGAVTTWQVAVAQYLDLFSWIGVMSSGAMPEAEDNLEFFQTVLVPALQTAKQNKHPIRMLLNFDGTKDMMLKSHLALHKCLLEYMARDNYLVPGKNYDFVLTEGDHSWDYWELYLYDMMHVFFQ